MVNRASTRPQLSLNLTPPTDPFKLSDGVATLSSDVRLTGDISGKCDSERQTALNALQPHRAFVEVLCDLNNGKEDGVTAGMKFKGYPVVWFDIAIVAKIPVRLFPYQPTLCYGRWCIISPFINFNRRFRVSQTVFHYWRYR